MASQPMTPSAGGSRPPVSAAPGKLRGAFILFEGLPPTVIDSQVLAHVREVRECLGIDMSVVAVACGGALYEESKSRLALAREASGGSVQLIRGVRPALPGSKFINRLLVGRALAQMSELSFVHARTDYTAAVVGPLAHRLGVSMLWDCRGDSRGELPEYMRGRSAILLPYRSWLLEQDLQIAGETCAAACFVTPQLRGLMTPFTAGKPTFVIPCLAAEDEFFFDPDLRENTRGALGISTDEVVHIYSGSLAAYQRFDQTVATFGNSIVAGQKARLIVLTPDTARARHMCAGLPDRSVIVKSVGHAEVNAYLNAADFGMLLRDSTPVNYSAFPTKFAEYAMTGLQVIMMESPPSCVEVAIELGNYRPAGSLAAPWSADERVRGASQSARRLGRRASMPIYADIYRRIACSDAGERFPFS